MNDIAIIRLRELAQLDQLQAHLAELLNTTDDVVMRRQIRIRMGRLRRLQRLWQYGQPNRSNQR